MYAKEIVMNDVKYKLEFWDTAGQERFHSFTKQFFRGVHGTIIMYDISARQSFRNVKHWMNQVIGIDDGRMSIILVGNKADLEDCRTVSTEEGEELAEEMDVLFTEMSVLDNAFLDEMVAALVEDIAVKQSPGAELLNARSLYETSSGVQSVALDSPQVDKKEGCC